MAMFDDAIEDLAGRFGFGSKAGPFCQEVVQLMTGSSGGIGGFIDKFRTAGFGSEVASWLGGTDGVPLTAPQVEKALGNATVGGIAGRLGLGGAAVASAIGYLMPKMIGRLTPGGVIPSSIPASVSSYLASSMQRPTVPPVQTTTRRVEQVAPRAINVIHDAPHLGRWLIPILAGLGVLGLLWYLLSGNNPRAPAVATAAPAPAVPAPPPAPVPSIPAHLALTNDDGIVSYAGVVHDHTTRTTIIDSLQGVFGAAKVKGDISVNANAGPAPWLVGFRTALENLKTSGVQAVFDGDSLKVGGLIGDADRDGIISSLRSTLGSGMVFGALTDQVGNLVSNMTSKAEAALLALPKGFATADLLKVLNQSIINFPTNSADIPAVSKTLLQHAASALKQLPPGTVIEIAGYTDNTGDPVANMQLSQQRAEAVRATLVEDGVDPGMLVAKGYGSASPIAGNDTLEGRFQNRRIEYRVVKPA
jgi:OmpA-OmpF porin, OOP family